jgi:hypothetical protein
MENTPLGPQFVAYPCTRSSFRLVRQGPSAPNRRPYSLDSAGGLSSENPTWLATVGMARYHLLWSHIPTPFTSVFNNYRLALNWADMLERPEDIDIMAINTYNVPPGQLWDAHQFAIHSGHKDDSIKKLAVKAVSMCFLI